MRSIDIREFVKHVAENKGVCTGICPSVDFCEDWCPLYDGDECDTETALHNAKKWLAKNKEEIMDCNEVSTCYKALDGTVFDTIEEAKQHNKKRKAIDEINAMLDAFKATLNDSAEDEHYGTDRDLFENFEAQLAVFLAQHMEVK